MHKRRLTKILVRAESREVAELSDQIKKTYSPVIVKEPEKSLAMIRLRDPVRGGAFYVGEVVVIQAAVEIDATDGFSVLMGEDFQKALDMAVIDAAVNKGVFSGFDELEALEKKQDERVMKEYAMTLKTIVDFNSMDQEAPNDLNAFQKA